MRRRVPHWCLVAAAGALALSATSVVRAEVQGKKYFAYVNQYTFHQSAVGQQGSSINDGLPNFDIATNDSGATQTTTSDLSNGKLTIHTKGTIAPSFGPNPHHECLTVIDLILDGPVTVSVQGEIHVDAGGYVKEDVAAGNFRSSHSLVGTSGSIPVDDHGQTEADDRSATIILELDGTNLSGGWDLTVTVDDLKLPVESHWTKAKSGLFGSAANWNPATVPGPDDIALFDVPGRPYTVTVGDRTTDQLRVQAGKPTFVNGDYAVGSDTLVVTGGAQLTLGSGFTLRGGRAVIGLSPAGTSSGVVVNGDGAAWLLGGPLHVGIQGDGALSIVKGSVVADRTVVGGAVAPTTGVGAVEVAGTGSEFQTGDLDVAFNDEGFFVARGGAFVKSDNVGVGGGGPAGCQARVTLDGTAGGVPTKWTAGSLSLYGGCDSLVTIRNGALMEVSGALLMGGFGETATSALLVSGRQGTSDAVLDVKGDLVIGSFLGPGDGHLRVATGGDVRCGGDFLVSDATDADGEVGSGTVEVAGGHLAISGEFVGTPIRIGVGQFGRGTMRLLNAGHVEVTSTVYREVQVGEDLGVGSLHVGAAGTNSSFVTPYDVSIGHLEGLGEIRVSTGNRLSARRVYVGELGTLIGERNVSATVVPLKGPPTEKAAAPPEPSLVECTELVNHGTVTADGLMVDGAFTQGADGVLVLAVSAGALQPLVVTGDVTLDGKLVLQFEDAFAPDAGVAVDLLDVQGTTTGAFAEVEVKGLEPGAQFQTAIVDGKLTATSATATTALASVTVKAKRATVSEKKAKKAGVFTFTRNGSTVVALDVTYAIGGSATNGADYAQLTGIVTIPAGAKSAKVNVQLVNDTLPEGEETIEVRVLPGPSNTRGKSPGATLRVLDDDGPRP